MTTTITTTHIVVGVDGSGGSSVALRWAAAEADLHGAVLTAVIAWGFLDQHHTDLDQRFDPAYNEGDALAALDRYLIAALGEERAAPVQRRAICEIPARALVEAADGADLLVVGARGLGGFKGLLLGSVSQHCLQHATVPVAVIRQERGTASGIVAAVDDSPTARRALQWAATEAAQRKTPLNVVYAWQLPPVYNTHAAALIDPADIERAARRELEKIVEHAGVADTGDLRLHTLRGTPASAVLHAAEDAELIVIGTRGRGPFKRMLLGSTATQVTNHATCPVVVVPPTR